VKLTQLGQRIRRMKPSTIDALIATAFIPISMIALATSGPDRTEGMKDPTAIAYVITLATVLPFYFRRRFPLPVFAIGTLGLMLLVVLDFETSPPSQIVLVGTYTVAAYCGARERAEGVAILAAAFLVLGVVGAPGLDAGGLFFNIAIFSAAYFWGATVRNRRMYLEELEARTSAAEREKAEEAKRAVADERLRIAQELHDVVAHSMGVIAVQAGVGAHVIETDAVEAKRSLEAIASTSRKTLTEIRRILGALRDDDGAAHEPAPGLSDLDRLVGDIKAAGVEVDVVFDGDSTEVPPGIDLTAYRIVQEALTNVLKHAGPAQASVRIGRYPGTLELEIVDNGRGVNGRSEAHAGHGLVGMRERVGVYGGRLEAGPRVGGGFRVLAELPYGASE
jgi:signal transduction histidine kinase